MTLQATTVVTFGEAVDSEYVFNLELDDFLNLDAEGNVKSSFSPEDQIYIRVNKSSNVNIEAIVATDGGIVKVGNATRNGTAQNLFTSRDPKTLDEFSLTHIPNSVSFSYVGRQGSLSANTSSIGVITYTPSQSYTPFLTNFNYTFPISSYLYTPPEIVLGEGETYDVAIVFYIKVT